MSDMKDENIIILYQCSVTVDSIVKSDVLAYRQCLFSYYLRVLDKKDAGFELFTNLFCAWVSVGNVSFKLISLVNATLYQHHLDVTTSHVVSRSMWHPRMLG